MVDNVKFNTPSTGSGDLTFGSAIAGFIAPGDSALEDGDTVRYRIVEVIEGVLCFEQGTGTIADSVAKLERTSVDQSYNGSALGMSKLDLGGTAIVGFTVSAADIVNPADPAALDNLGGTTVGKALFTAANAADARAVTGVIYPPQGRLTLQSGVPVMTTAQSSKTTLYYTPYVGNQIPIYDGTKAVPTNFSELSTTTTDTTHNPAAIGAGEVHDWFVWNDGGTLRLCHGPAWSNSTTRSAGTALTRVSAGILVNAVAITSGPGSLQGTYVGTTTVNSISQFNFLPGTSASGGGFGYIGLWNAYNRRPAHFFVRDSTTNWSYTTAAWRAANNSTANSIAFVRGLDEDGVEALYSLLAFATSGAAQIGIGIGLDETNAIAANATSFVSYYSLGGNNQGPGVATYSGHPGIGYHYLQAIEYGGANGAFNSNTTLHKGGLSATLWY
nr:DUF2793 domain-containing protein [Nitrobacter winogradskyi]